jgi:Ca2+-transporting ATPase
VTSEGLSFREAAQRVARDGPNELSSAKRPSFVASALAITREPMSLLLLACGAVYLFLGDRRESLMLLGFVIFILGITLFQERKTERALEALRDMASPRALVVRDGHRVRIASREVVLGDVVVLSEGDRVPADATVLSCTNLVVDESLLTGESASVRKTPWDGKLGVTRPGGNELPFVYSGSLVIEGAAVARVHATGARTEIGRIGRALETDAEQETALERETRTLVNRLAWISAGLSVLVVIVYGLSRGNWLGGILAGLTLAMAILPNEIPVVVTIFLALGAWRMSKRRVLRRRMPAVETVGSATVCASTGACASAAACRGRGCRAPNRAGRRRFARDRRGTRHDECRGTPPTCEHDAGIRACSSGAKARDRRGDARQLRHRRDDGRRRE